MVQAYLQKRAERIANKEFKKTEDKMRKQAENLAVSQIPVLESQIKMKKKEKENLSRKLSKATEVLDKYSRNTDNVTPKQMREQENIKKNLEDQINKLTEEITLLENKIKQFKTLTTNADNLLKETNKKAEEEREKSKNNLLMMQLAKGVEKKSKKCK